MGWKIHFITFSIGTYGSDQVGLGMHDKRLEEESKQLIDIVKVFVHPQYDKPDRSHDVGKKLSV